MTDLTLSSRIVKDRLKVLVVGVSMEGEASISVQPKSIVVPIITAPSSFTTLEDVGSDVNEEVVGVTKATTMEE
jgi:hypothetical protein